MFRGLGRAAVPAVPAGDRLTRRTIWHAVAAGVFVPKGAFQEVGGFVPLYQTGAGAPWNVRESTNLHLRVMDRDLPVLGATSVVVHGAGEPRGLDPRRLTAEQRAYARGVGFVHRPHGCLLADRARSLAGPLIKVVRHDPGRCVSPRLAVARLVGSVERLWRMVVAVPSLPLDPASGAVVWVCLAELGLAERALIAGERWS